MHICLGHLAEGNGDLWMLDTSMFAGLSPLLRYLWVLLGALLTAAAAWTHSYTTSCPRSLNCSSPPAPELSGWAFCQSSTGTAPQPPVDCSAPGGLDSKGRDPRGCPTRHKGTATAKQGSVQSSASCLPASCKATEVTAHLPQQLMQRVALLICDGGAVVPHCQPHDAGTVPCWSGVLEGRASTVDDGVGATLLVFVQVVADGITQPRAELLWLDAAV